MLALVEAVALLRIIDRVDRVALLLEGFDDLASLAGGQFTYAADTVGYVFRVSYAGKPAAFLRGFRALYLALPVNTIIMGWVNLAMAKVLVVISFSSSTTFSALPKQVLRYRLF